MDKIDVTPLALENIKEMRSEYGDHADGLRFGLAGGGCSGWKYVLEFEDAATATAEDMVYSFEGLKVFVAKKHLEMLKNSVIGWEDSLMSSGFAIENPQAKRPCGCGESVDF
jgi:iron-sulfur cluster assembly protein